MWPFTCTAISFALIISLLCIHSTVMNIKQKTRMELLGSFQRASNGFDMRGIVESDDTRHSTKLDGPLLTYAAAFWVGVGFGESLKQLNAVGTPLAVGIGRDSRESGVILTEWLAGGLEAVGVMAYDVGLSTTPAMFLSCISEKENDGYITSGWPFAGAISVTASHLPSQWNGFKFFTPDTPSNIGEEGIQAIIDSCASKQFDALTPVPSDFQGRTVSSFLPTYSKYLQKAARDLISQSFDGETVGQEFTGSDKIDSVQFPLKGLKICVNAGNGAGGFLAATLEELGADCSSSLHLDPDGTFPNHIANPEDKKAIQCTADAVQRAGADVGICLDTDADRVGLVEGRKDEVSEMKGNSEAKLLNRNCLVALVSKVALRGVVGGVIVTDSATSNGVSRFIEGTLGGRHLRYKKGYRFVIEKGRSIEGCEAAVECSGHGAWRDNGWVDDGCYTAVKLVAELSVMRRKQREAAQDRNAGNDVGSGVGRGRLCRLSDLLQGLEEPAESVELRFKVTAGPAKMAEVTQLALETFRSVALSDKCNAVGGGEESSYSWHIEEVNYEGLRVNFDFTLKTHGSKPRKLNGWCMLRASLHEPILSMQIECDEVGGVAEAARILLTGSCTSIADPAPLIADPGPRILDAGFKALGSLMDITPLEKLSRTTVANNETNL